MSPTHCRKNLFEEPAWASSEQFCRIEAAAARERLPIAKWDWVRHGEVPAADVVLHDHQPPAGFEIGANQPHHPIFVMLKVKRVRHHDPVEGRNLNGAGEIGGEVMGGQVWKSLPHESFLLR